MKQGRLIDSDPGQVYCSSNFLSNGNLVELGTPDNSMKLQPNIFSQSQLSTATRRNTYTLKQTHTFSSRFSKLSICSPRNLLLFMGHLRFNTATLCLRTGSSQATYCFNTGYLLDGSKIPFYKPYCNIVVLTIFPPANNFNLQSLDMIVMYCTEKVLLK